MEFSIVIPFYGKWELTHQRMMELYKNIINPVEIVLIDDFSKEDHTDRMNWWKGNGKHSVRAFRNDENLGFGQSMNRGCDLSSGEIVVLLSNDIQVIGDFTSEILSILKSGEKTLIGDILYTHDTGWNIFEINGKKKLFPYLGGHFLACRKTSWEDIGGFDPIYGKFDVEDIDLSTMALYKGYTLVFLKNMYVNHLYGQTIRSLHPNREEYTKRNLRVFQKKWSEILKDE